MNDQRSLMHLINVKRLRMTLLLVVIFTTLTTKFSLSQTVTNNWTANCGTPVSFQDPGGAGNYSGNLHYVYTICPGDPNYYASVTFSNLNLGANDYISIVNGDNSQFPYINTLSAVDNFTSPSMTITSSGANGCLTLIFGSDANNHGSGWNATYNCVQNPGNNTLICQETDCVGGCARTVCGSGTYTWQNAGENMQDLNNVNAGCLTAHSPNLERNHVWYYINPMSPGVLEVLIESGAGGQIYDFALWKSTGETIVCPGFSGDAPILCEAENNGQNNTTPQGSGFSNDIWIDDDNPTNQPYHAFPGYEPAITVTQADIDAGAVYMLLINVRSNGTPQPVVNISMDGELDCTPLNVELVSFNGSHHDGTNFLQWETQSEIDNSHFIIERSINSFDWEILNFVNGSGTTSQSMSYSLEDRNPYYPLTYYRLKQVDISGEVTLYKTIGLNGMKESQNWISSVYPNPAQNELNILHDDPNLENPLFIRLYNNLGQIVYDQNFQLEDKVFAHTMNVSDIEKGIYTLQIQKGERIHTERIVLLGNY